MLARSLTCLALALAFSTTSSAQVEQLFDAPAFLPGAEGGEFRALGDFDGDGLPDLLHMSSPSAWDGMQLMLADGSGHYVPQPALTWALPGGVLYAQLPPTVGDFNGDGDLDVALDRTGLATTSAGLAVFLGNGAGGFATELLVPLGASVESVHAGAMDADLATELLVKFSDPSGQSLLAWLDWGTASFQLMPTLALGPPAGTPGLLVEALGDLDGDGDDDVAAFSTWPYSEVRTFSTVAGTLMALSSFTVPLPMQTSNAWLAAGDADGDGDIDFLHVAAASGPGLWVRPFENLGGSLKPHLPELVPTPSLGSFEPHQLELTDWDGDGWLDLLSASSNVDLVRSNGDWTFTEGLELVDFSQSAGAGAADFNADGAMDFAGARVLHYGKGSFSGPAASLAGPSLLLASFPGGFVPDDLEGDGDLDLSGGFRGERYLNDGTGLFDFAVPADGPFGSFFPTLASPFLYGTTSAFADFTGDGRRDYLVTVLRSVTSFGTAFFEMRILADNGIDGYVDHGPGSPPGVAIGPPLGPQPQHWRGADADGDGDLDLLVQGGYWRNSGGGLFDSLIPTGLGRLWDAGDVDGDGDIDLLVSITVGASSKIRLLRRTPSGAFAKVSIGSVAGQAAARFVDLDLDGDLDIAAADPEGHALLLAQDLGKQFSDPIVLDAEVRNLAMLGVSDTDGDGLVDLLALRSQAVGGQTPVTLLTEYHRKGASLNYSIASEAYLPPAVTESARGLLDVDGDGDLDLLGELIRLNQQVTALQSGVTQQFGRGSAGTGGVLPVLGAKGPASSANPGFELHLVQAAGAAQLLLAFSLIEVELADLPLPGMTLYVGAPTLIGPFGLGGTPGQAGAGSLALSVPLDPALFGLEFIHQGFVLDSGAPGGVAATNGLRITYGL